ncbi:12224_t:CDS:2 [Funneliformis caledonium]|uniref:12224_t:CDS:1 n=1 Tax=Funneliformis caledonium TaxID=1117310 RepID=A0A9N9FVI4_9GLOM|nr:12224_t:CDS:2 [Funneliformis caledonium]
MNDNTSDEGNYRSDDNLLKTIQNNGQISLRKFNRIHDKINIQSDGSKHKGKGVKDDSTYEEESINGDEEYQEDGKEGGTTIIRRSKRLKDKPSSMNYAKENFWMINDDLEGSDEGSKMKVDNRDSDENGESERDYIVSVIEGMKCKKNEDDEDEEMNDEESHVPFTERNGMDNNNSSNVNQNNLERTFK